MNNDTIITLEQLIELGKRWEAAVEEAANLDIALTQLLTIHTGLKVGMELIVTEEGSKHIGGAPIIDVGSKATISAITVSQRGGVTVYVNYNDWGSNAQSLERAQGMRAAYLNGEK